jgi:hypothetical protein
MNPQEITQQWIAFQKQSYENFQSIWQLTQDQTSSTVDRLLDQTVWVPQESRRFFDNWQVLMNKENDRFAAFMERGFGIYEEMIEPSKDVPATQTKQKKTE